MRRKIEIAFVFLGGVAVVAWLCDPNDPIREPIAAVFGGTSLLSLLDLLWPRPTDAERDERRARRNQLFSTALRRIEHEWNHVEGMCANPATYAGKSYAEETALELIDRDIRPLVQYWGFRRTVQKALVEIERNAQLPTGSKEVRPLLAMLTSIRAKLKKCLR